MSLSLQLVNETTLPDGGPVSFRISGKRGIDIGRDAHLDWTLPDPTRYVSSKHCEIRYKDGGYWLHDVSTNGTFLNGADHRMSTPHRLAVATASGRPLPRGGLGRRRGRIGKRPRESHAAGGRTQGELRRGFWASPETSSAHRSKQLRPARQRTRPLRFLDWAADVPGPFQAPAPPYRRRHWPRRRRRDRPSVPT